MGRITLSYVFLKLIQGLITFAQEVSNDFRDEIVTELGEVMELFEDERMHAMVTKYFDLVHWYLYHSQLLLTPLITPLATLV
jgi:hypothetical protein